MGGLKSKGHKNVPVVVLNHNPKVRTSDKPSAGVIRNDTNLAKDTAGYGNSRPTR